MANVYFGLGSNLGNREDNLYQAVRLMEKRIGDKVSLSAFYRTAPWGFESENDFLNAAVQFSTQLTPREILSVTKNIEKELGRTRKTNGDVYSDRLIDIDLLVYDDVILNCDELILPHPLMTQREFVMVPLAEIAPNLCHPILKKSTQELLLLLQGQ